MASKALIAAACLALGCAPALPSGYYPPALGVAAEGDLVPLCWDAAGRWETAAGLEVVCDQGRPMRLGPLPRDCATGYTDRRRVVIEDDDLGGACAELEPADYMPDTVAHELGHVLAGKRKPSHAADGLMSQEASGARLITWATLEWICETAPCRWMQPE